jgi:hypothetical protein
MGARRVMLHHNYLSAVETLPDQSVPWDLWRPSELFAFANPLDGQWYMAFVSRVLAAFCFISARINVFASAGALSAFARRGPGNWSGCLTRVLRLGHDISHDQSQCFQWVGPVSALVVLMAWWPGHHDFKLSTKIMQGTESFSVLGE